MRNLSGHNIYEFGEFALDVDKLMLYRGEEEVSIPPKAAKTLSVLVENRGEILSKDELMERVWEDSFVDESNLSQYLYLLRKILGNKPDGNPYIETLRRRGYRFNGDVRFRVPDDGVLRAERAARPSLIGREKEIGSVIALLKRADVRLVTVSGVGGVGKTTLAKAVMDAWEGRRQVFFVELAAVNRPELVLSTLASALGVKETPGTPLLESVDAELKSRSPILVLDNFEQIAEAAPILSALINTAGSGLKILVTSRVALRIAEETVYNLPPLPFPDAESSRVEELSKCESLELFAERARAVSPEFELTPANVKDVSSICRRLEGLPLAIELAAARMNFMSPAAVLKRLEKQLEILKGGAPGAPQRQRTIRETIAWSYDLLPDREKRMFERLGVFAGGFDLDGAEAVCSQMARRSPLEVLDAVTSLLEHNLLAARNAPNGEPRVYMLEVVREFALEMLAQQGDPEEARLAHAEHFLRLGEVAEPELVAARSSTWLERLEAEHDNLREALSWSKTRNPSLGQRLAGSIWRFWWLHGHIREACEQLDEFLGLPFSDQAVRAKMLSGATFIHRLAGNAEPSRRYADEAAKLSEATGDLRNGALAYNQLGFLAVDTRDFSEAGRMFALGLNKAEALGDIQVLALLNNGLGELSRQKGDYDRAAEFYGVALEYNRKAGDRVRQTTCLINLGATALMRGDREAAGTFYRGGLEISSAMEDMNGTLYCLEGFAGSYWAVRDTERAAMLLGAADAGRKLNNLLLEPADKEPYDRSLTFVRSELGENRFEEKFSDGSKMSIKAAIAAALGEAEGPIHLQAPKAAPSGRMAVERQGNVLRLIEWQAAREAAETGDKIPSPVLRPRPSRSRPWVLFALTSAAIVAVLAFAISRLPLGPDSGHSAMSVDIDINRLTNENYVRDATISRDGNYFAYSELAEGTSRIWIQQTGQTSRLEVVPAGDWTHCCKTFSPDGKFLYFVAWKDQNSRNLYRVPTLGGAPEKVLPDVHSWVSFSPDGSELTFLRGEGASVSMLVAPSNGKGPARRVLGPESGLKIGAPASWSPDGKTMVFAGFASDDPPSFRLFSLDLASGVTSRISEELWSSSHRIEWMRDGKALVMVATRFGETLSTRRDQVYMISFPSGRSQRLTTDAGRHEPESLGVTDGGSIFAVSFNRASQIWSIDSSGESRSAVQLTTGVGEGRGGMATMPDGRIGFTVLGEGGVSLWTVAADGSDKRLLRPESRAEMLSATPDGRHFVYRDNIDNKDHIYRVAADGGEPVRLTSDETDPTRKGYTSVSPDGLWVIYESEPIQNGTLKKQVRKVSIEGGEPRLLVDGGGGAPEYSPDGRYIACSVYDKNKLEVRSATDGSLVATFDAAMTSPLEPKWTPDSQSLVYIVTRNNVCNLWRQPTTGGRPEPLTDFTSGQCHNFVYSRDGSRIYLARGYESRDAILISFNNK